MPTSEMNGYKKEKDRRGWATTISAEWVHRVGGVPGRFPRQSHLALTKEGVTSVNSMTTCGA